MKTTFFASKVLYGLCVIFLAGCISQQTADKLNSRTDQLAQKTADAIFDRLDRVIPGIFLEDVSTRAGLPQGMKLRKISDEGIKITKAFEGFEPELYNDPAGNCTIGYGHLIKKSRCNGDEPGEISHCEVSRAGELRTSITLMRGEQILRCDILIAEVAVTQLVRPDLTDGQFSALVDFAFNVGTGNFAKSTLLRVVNSGDYSRVPGEFRRWIRVGPNILRGLQKRREEQIALFFGSSMKGVGKMPEEAELIDIREGEFSH